tara:strand:+ start:341 stop:1903 length:1563 start_codon:yes stop_codon:yes gene_type:complete
MAATFDTFFFDGLNFVDATTVFDDAALTVVAADGFYAQNGIVRQQSNGVLLNPQDCSNCIVACGSGISASFSSSGYFNAIVDVANSTGAVVMYFYMGNSIPDGVLATYNNVQYNLLGAKNNLNTVTLRDDNGTTLDIAGENNQPATATNPTYVGNFNALLPGTYNNVSEYNLVGSGYQQTGATRNITVVNNQVGCATDPDSPVFTMVVPKTEVSVTTIQVEIFAPMTGTVFHWQILCPDNLINFTGTALQNDTTCASGNVEYYFARNATGTSSPFTIDTNTTPEVGNLVFDDPNGSTFTNFSNTERFIIINSTTAIGVRHGTVTQVVACSNTGGFKAFQSSIKQNTGINSICDGGVTPNTNQTFYHDGTGIGPGNVYPDTGDTVYADANGNTTLPTGVYYLYTSGGVAQYMTIGIGGTATTGTCTPPTQTFFMSGVAQACNDFCQNNYNITVPRGTTTNDLYADVQIGDTIAGSTLTQGWYAYAATSTNTQSGTFRQMQIGNANIILSLAECDGGSCIPL